MANFRRKLNGLDKAYFKKNRQWEVENDYVADLIKQSKSTNVSLANQAKEALAFLEQFNAEFHDGSKLNSPAALHKTPEMRKSCYDRSNSSYRDLTSIKTCNTQLGLANIDNCSLEADQLNMSNPELLLEFVELEEELERQRTIYGKNFSKK